MSDQNIRLQVADGVAHIELDRSGNSHSFELPTARAFGEATRASMIAAPDPSSYLKELADVHDGALQRLDSMNKPVVAAVQGAVAGAWDVARSSAGADESVTISRAVTTPGAATLIAKLASI